MDTINVGDICLVGDKYRILVYNMVDAYFFINTKGEQATDNFKSLEEVVNYCNQNHVKNLTKDYKNRIYTSTGMYLAEVFEDPINFMFEILCTKAAKDIGVDKTKHIVASRGLYTLGGDTTEKSIDDPLQILVSSFIGTLAIGIEKECKDRNLPVDEFDTLFRDKLKNIQDELIEVMVYADQYKLDRGDLYAGFIGIAIGMLSSACRELLYYTQSKE